MFRALFVGLPVHARGALVVHLHAVHAAVALAGVGIAREHQGQRDEAAAIIRPALQNRVIEQREPVGAHYFLARSLGHDLGEKRAHLGQFGQHFQLADKPLGHAHLQELHDAPRHFLHRVHFESDLHLAHRRKGVHQHRDLVAGGPLKQQRRSAPLHRAVGEFGDLQARIHFEGNAHQFIVLFERAHKLAQILIGHNL